MLQLRYQSRDYYSHSHHSGAYVLLTNRSLRGEMQAEMLLPRERLCRQGTLLGAKIGKSMKGQLCEEGFSAEKGVR